MKPPQEYIEIRGAREHNLKNIDLRIPRNKLVVVTGLSGSGKSSLAFDTIYAEGQRRYLESLSSYARQFLEKIRKPEVDYISGLSPSIAIEQRHSAHNPRLPAPALCQGGRADLPPLRRTADEPDPGGNTRRNPEPRGRRRGAALCPARARPQGRVPAAVSGPA
jgi:hypothetical protein